MQKGVLSMKKAKKNSKKFEIYQIPLLGILGGRETILAMNEELVTVDEVAAYTKLSRATIRKYVLGREIPFLKIKKAVRFRLSEIDRWIEGGGSMAPSEVADDGSGLLSFAESGE
jgi:excisionase family DNA binding protein